MTSASCDKTQNEFTMLPYPPSFSLSEAVCGWSCVRPISPPALCSLISRRITHTALTLLHGNISIVSDEFSFTRHPFNISVIMHKVVRLSHDSLESEGRDSLDSSHQSSDSLVAINDSLGKIGYLLSFIRSLVK